MPPRQIPRIIPVNSRGKEVATLGRPIEDEIKAKPPSDSDDYGDDFEVDCF